MAQVKSHALSEVLDELENSATGDTTAVSEVIDAMGRRSFASIMLIFSLVSSSPVSAIPGMTAFVGTVIFFIVIQMLAGRNSLWLPQFITRRTISTEKLRKAITWLRKPVRSVERFLKSRLTFLFHRPYIWLPLLLIMALTLCMPFLEFIPGSGSIASIVIALFAAGLLTRDGALVIVSLVALLAVPLAIWQIGF
ncbi:exopolysaccharide biosynthesis protein [Neptunicoccus cionae]|uniref:Exopolysaccharide biosynthesis protein ExoD n=1 Tax=Neptunicoccus cionae TaxID=2035344 RepID=A0A916QR30_9RHOB|nr:exopolysaccharide biosynthesis protein [Amylibacter cionae]GGA07517.1 exopolysaccharide biosynthesis protein ExoD [Amylibacter cionae]